MGDFSSSAQFFVTLAALVFLYCVAALVVYIGYNHVYRQNNKFPLTVSLTEIFYHFEATKRWEMLLRIIGEYSVITKVKWSVSTGISDLYPYSTQAEKGPKALGHPWHHNLCSYWSSGMSSLLQVKCTFTITSFLSCIWVCNCSRGGISSVNLRIFSVWSTCCNWQKGIVTLWILVTFNIEALNEKFHNILENGLSDLSSQILACQPSRF